MAAAPCWAVLLVGLVILSATLLASEVGVRIGARLRGDDRTIAEHNTLQAALLGLLALLLGFSFAMAVSRFDTRKQVMLEEVVAIGTADLRTQAVPDPPGARLHALLREYVQRRLQLYHRQTSLDEELASSDRLEHEAWPLVAELARADPRSVAVGLLMQSLNEVIDLNTKRIAVTRNHVPRTVWVVLAVIASVAMGWGGLCLALSGHRGLPTRVLLALAIAFVSAMIVDLDQPRRGLIRISEEALQRVDASLRDGR